MKCYNKYNKYFVVQNLFMKDQFKNVRWCKNLRGSKINKFVDFMPKIGGVKFSHDFGFFGTLKNSSLDIVLPRQTFTRHQILWRQNSFLRKTYLYAISLCRRIFCQSKEFLALCTRSDFMTRWDRTPRFFATIKISKFKRSYTGTHQWYKYIQQMN